LAKPHLPRFPIAVNLSATQFRQQDLCPSSRDPEIHRISIKVLELEITERR